MTARASVTVVTITRRVRLHDRGRTRVLLPGSKVPVVESLADGRVTVTVEGPEGSIRVRLPLGAFTFDTAWVPPPRDAADQQGNGGQDHRIVAGADQASRAGGSGAWSTH